MKTAIEVRIRGALKKQGLSVSSFAQQLGVSRVALYHLFKGHYSRPMLEKVSYRLNIPTHILISPLPSNDNPASPTPLTEHSDINQLYQAATQKTQQAVYRMLSQTHRPDPSHGVQDTRARKRPLVIVVDDLEDNVQFITRCLRTHYDILPFTSPQQALQAVHSHQPDIVISDQRMPEMTGTELMLAAKKSGHPFHKVIISAFCDNTALLSAINDVAVDAFLLKPFKPEQLRDTLHKFVDNQATTLH